MVASMLPMTLIFNHFLFGPRYFESLGNFALATSVTFVLLCLAFISYGLISILLRSRFPGEEQLMMRLGLSIVIFVLMTGVYLSLVCKGYDLVNFLNYDYHEKDFTRCFITFVVMNIFLTFLNEGVYRFESYKRNLKETEQLKKEYMHSQLLGLKSQMNPHFLFNGLNTLSSLIQEDAEKAEDFLDHMSKVYRYLLRNNEEHLVSLKTEINFIQSYYYLLKARYGDALHLSVNIHQTREEDLLPPLTLQMIFENILNSNAVSRNRPLDITIRTEHGRLIVSHNIQPRQNSQEDNGQGLENISNKFRLLCQKEMQMETTQCERIIRLPLIPSKELIEA